MFRRWWRVARFGTLALLLISCQHLRENNQKYLLNVAMHTTINHTPEECNEIIEKLPTPRIIFSDQSEYDPSELTIFYVKGDWNDFFHEAMHHYTVMLPRICYLELIARIAVRNRALKMSNGRLKSQIKMLRR